jgi:hypothetical protein
MENDQIPPLAAPNGGSEGERGRRTAACDTGNSSVPELDSRRYFGDRRLRAMRPDDTAQRRAERSQTTRTLLTICVLASQVCVFSWQVLVDIERAGCQDASVPSKN